MDLFFFFLFWGLRNNSLYFVQQINTICTNSLCSQPSVSRVVHISVSGHEKIWFAETHLQTKVLPLNYLLLTWALPGARKPRRGVRERPVWGRAWWWCHSGGVHMGTTHTFITAPGRSLNSLTYCDSLRHHDRSHHYRHSSLITDLPILYIIYHQLIEKHSYSSY